MEKIAIISDVHGNITALNTVLADIKQRGIKRIFSLGDNVIKCTHPDLVIDKLRESCEVILLGNADYVVSQDTENAKHFWSRKKIGEERAAFLRSLPIFYEFYMSGYFIRLFHACPYNLDDIYNPMFSNTKNGISSYKKEIYSPAEMFKNTEFLGKGPGDKEPDIVGFGHIHTPFVVRFGNKTLFNPGSVGLSVEMMNSDLSDPSNKFSTLASYIIIEGNYGNQDLSPISFNLVRLPYNVQKEIEDVENSDMSNKEMVIKSLKGALPTVYN